MKLIQGITDKPKQEINIVLADGTTATWLLEYRPNQLGWVYKLTWSTHVIQGRRVASAPNMLRQFRDVLPFGLAVIVNGGAEVYNQRDFSNNTAQVYLLDSADVALVEETVYART